MAFVSCAPLHLEFSTEKEPETLVFIPQMVAMHILHAIMDLDPSLFSNKCINSHFCDF